MTKRSMFQRARIDDGNGHTVTSWGMTLTTFQLVLTLLAAILGTALTVRTLAGEWVDYKARGVAEVESKAARDEILLIHDKDIVALKQTIEHDQKDREEIIQRLDRLETKLDNYMAERRR